MNAATGELNGLHKVYLQCVDKEMSHYLSSAQVRADSKATEFCAADKQAYLASMKSGFPHQYANVLRVEANTY